jgi:hypothetical protein
MLYVDHLLTGFRPLGRDIVHIKVGEEEQDALSSGFEEAKTGVMKLPQTDATFFDIFYGWLYRQKLWSKDAKEEDLVKLYVFADMPRIPSLQKPGIENSPQDIRYQQQLPLFHDGLCLGKYSLNKPSPPLLPWPNYLGICT